VAVAQRAPQVPDVAGAGRGIVTDGGRELALGCFDAPDACDVGDLRRALRYRHLLGR
jgi:hypothetical protein